MPKTSLVEAQKELLSYVDPEKARFLSKALEDITNQALFFSPLDVTDQTRLHFQELSYLKEHLNQIACTGGFCLCEQV
jgi:hypothetical protein